MVLGEMKRHWGGETVGGNWKNIALIFCHYSVLGKKKKKKKCGKETKEKKRLLGFAILGFLSTPQSPIGGSILLHLSLFILIIRVAFCISALPPTFFSLIFIYLVLSFVICFLPFHFWPTYCSNFVQERAKYSHKRDIFTTFC